MRFTSKSHRRRVTPAATPAVVDDADAPAALQDGDDGHVSNPFGKNVFFGFFGFFSFLLLLAKGKSSLCTLRRATERYASGRGTCWLVVARRSGGTRREETGALSNATAARGLESVRGWRSRRSRVTFLFFLVRKSPSWQNKAMMRQERAASGGGLSSQSSGRFFYFLRRGKQSVRGKANSGKWGTRQ